MRRVLIPSHVPTLAPLASRAAQDVSEVAMLAGEAMGTIWSVKAITKSPRCQLRRLIEARLSLVIAQMSQWEAGSDLSGFNAAPAGTWCNIPEEFFALMDHAISLARDTDGAFDPTLGVLSERWGFGASGRRSDVPDEIAVDEARARTGWWRVRIDPSRRAICQPGGVALDLCAIAKGFAVDLVSETLSKHGVVDHLVEIGGELRGSGTKPDLSPWWVEIEGAPDIVVALHGLAVATSGDARRFIDHDGRRLSHTLDPRTGRPIPDALTSVTVVAPSCMKADALATALSVLGPEKGMQYARKRGIAARFAIRSANGLVERVTPAFAEMLG